MKKYLFILLVFVVTWLLWLPSMLNRYYHVPNVFLIISMIASFTPTVVGIIFMRKNKMNIKERLRFTNLRYYWIIPLVFIVVSVVPYLVARSQIEIIYQFPFWMSPVVFLQILFIGGALGEEFGWRGYLYPALKEKFTPFITALIIGVIWSIWHLPLFFMEGTVQSAIPMWQFMIQNTVISFYYLWIYEKTNGNLLLLIYLHAIANTAAAVLPYWQVDIARYVSLFMMLISLAVIFKAEKISLRIN